MSNALVLALVAVAVSLIAVLLAVRSSGPRITTRRDDDKDGDAA
jgi:hypothetical protein